MSWPADPLRRILAAVDGSSTSRKAAEVAFGLAARDDAYWCCCTSSTTP